MNAWAATVSRPISPVSRGPANEAVIAGAITSSGPRWTSAGTNRSATVIAAMRTSGIASSAGLDFQGCRIPAPFRRLAISLPCTRSVAAASVSPDGTSAEGPGSLGSGRRPTARRRSCRPVDSPPGLVRARTISVLRPANRLRRLRGLLFMENATRVPSAVPFAERSQQPFGERFLTPRFSGIYRLTWGASGFENSHRLGPAPVKAATLPDPNPTVSGGWHWPCAAAGSRPPPGPGPPDSRRRRPGRQRA
ncbi:hypothetical protein KAURM247S_06277 [Kitasatospora aureofaciens]